MRLCLSILRQDDNLRDLLDSSSGYIPVDSELFQDLLEDAVYNVAAILYEIECEERVHPQTRLNLERFVDRYDYLAEEGKFRVIEDHCLVDLREIKNETLFRYRGIRWNRDERISDRYGSVGLWNDYRLCLSNDKLKDKVGTLKAIIIETRESHHFGDIFRGLFPSTPEIGDVIELGHGILWFEDGL